MSPEGTIVTGELKPVDFSKMLNEADLHPGYLMLFLKLSQDFKRIYRNFSYVIHLDL